ncbi:MAG: hypothetical protein CMC48_07020 [Flavobacteriaceae bacterium]|nr:hypothetical protein [Flavobacteriaceae bacterium]|tara:strand:+ start:118 stop:837 length:720 start_codon:yes stop_codon:yes gene_type:complete
MKIYFTVISLFFVINITLSQTSFNYGVVNFDVVKKINVGDQNVSNVFRGSNLSSIKGIVGSPYRNNSFQIGIIYRNKDSVKTFLRYNALNDEIEVALSKEASSSTNAIIKSESISCKIINDFFVYKEFIDENKFKNKGYLIKAYAGEKYNLYVRDKKVFKEGEKPKNSLELGKPPKFIDKQTVFIQYMSDLPKAVKLKYKKILELIAKEDQVKLAKLKNSHRKINSLDKLISLISSIDK